MRRGGPMVKRVRLGGAKGKNKDPGLKEKHGAQKRISPAFSKAAGFQRAEPFGIPQERNTPGHAIQFSKAERGNRTMQVSNNVKEGAAPTCLCREACKQYSSS